MKTKAVLTVTEIRDAIRTYVEVKTGGKVIPNGVTINLTQAQGSAASLTGATVEYET